MKRIFRNQTLIINLILILKCFRIVKNVSEIKKTYFHAYLIHYDYLYLSLQLYILN